MEEIWKPIIGYEGRYEVSNLGRIKSIKILKPVFRKITDNYTSRTIRLSQNGKTTESSVARVMAKAFIPNPENKSCVNHIDNNPQNNSLNNLEWVTYKENTQHSVDSGRMRNGHKCKLQEDEVMFIRNNKSIPVKILSIKYNVSIQAIYNVLKNKNWKIIK